MANIKCPHCGESTDANKSNCEHCGKAITKVNVDAIELSRKEKMNAKNTNQIIQK